MVRIDTTNCNNFQHILDYLQKINREQSTDSEKLELLKSEDLEKFLCVGKQFIYFPSFLNPENNFIFITPSVEHVLGYKPEELSSRKIYDLIHPSDRGLIVKANIKSIEIQHKLREEPMKFIFHADFRIRKKCGEYIRVSRQTTNYKNDKSGLMVLSIAILTDVSHLKTSNKIDFYYTGPEYPKLNFPDKELLNENNHNLTKREKQIIGYLEKGKSSREIACQLSISKHTVDKHRSNILEKLSLKNTIEIVTYAKENQIV